MSTPPPPRRPLSPKSQKAAEYLRRAAEHESMAGQTSNKRLKASFIKIAQQYRELAEQANRAELPK